MFCCCLLAYPRLQADEQSGWVVVVALLAIGCFGAFPALLISALVGRAPARDADDTSDDGWRMDGGIRW